MFANHLPSKSVLKSCTCGEIRISQKTVFTDRHFSRHSGHKFVLHIPRLALQIVKDLKLIYCNSCFLIHASTLEHVNSKPAKKPKECADVLYH